MKVDNNVDGPDNFEQRIQHLTRELNKTKEVLAWHRIELRAAENKIDELKANGRTNETIGTNSATTSQLEMDDKERESLKSQIADLTKQVEKEKSINNDLKSQINNSSTNSNSNEELMEVEDEEGSINLKEEAVKSTSRKRKHSSLDSNVEKDLLIKHLQDSLVEKIKLLVKLKKMVKTDLETHSTVAKQLRDLYQRSVEENKEIRKTTEEKDNDLVKLTAINNELVDKLKDFEQVKSELDTSKTENNALADKLEEYNKTKEELTASSSVIGQLKTQNESLKRRLREIEEVDQPTTSAASQLAQSNQEVSAEQRYETYTLKGQLKAEKIRRQTLESRLSDEEKGDAQAEVVNEFEAAIEALFVQASQARSRGNNLEAIQLLQEAIGIELGGLNDLMNLSKLSSAMANSFEILKQYDAAIEWCTKAVEYMPKDFNCLLQRARLYQQKRDFKNAMADLGKCLRLNPGSKKAKSLREKIEKDAASLPT